MTTGDSSAETSTLETCSKGAVISIGIASTLAAAVGGRLEAGAW
jgi:hypothetical protein